MKNAIIGVAVGVLILLFSFQNCQKPPYPDVISSQNLKTIGSTGKIDLNQEVVDSVSFLVQATKTVTQAGSFYQINYNKILNIDLKTGIISESSDMSSETVNYCLTESLKDELVAIIKSSQICRTQPTLQEGAVCAQVVKMPYAQLFTSREQFDLGSASDSCGSNGVDLCGDQVNLLKGYIEAVKNQYQQLVCP